MKTRFYGIFPLINMIVSYRIFLVIKFRIWSLKVFNRLRRSANGEFEHYTRDGSPKEDLARYYNMGFKKLNLGGGTRNLERYVIIDFVSHPQVERSLQISAISISSPQRV
jgi:hypothetical protein